MEHIRLVDQRYPDYLFLFRILIPILILTSFEFGEMKKSCIDFVSFGTEPA